MNLEKERKLEQAKRSLDKDKQIIKDAFLTPQEIDENRAIYNALVDSMMEMEDRCKFDNQYKDKEIMRNIIKMELFAGKKYNDINYITTYTILKSAKDKYGLSSSEFKQARQDELARLVNNNKTKKDDNEDNLEFKR